MRSSRRLALALALALTAGCALTKRSPPVVLRHFTPDVAHEESPRAAPCGVLSLGRTTASAHLRYRIVHRTSPVEIALYETLRWTDHPDVYVRRALEQHLFEAGGLVHSTSRADQSLEVDVLGFEQVDTPSPSGRVQLAYELRDDRAVVASGIVTVTRPSKGTRIEAVVAAIGEATEAATAEVARRIVPLVRARAGCAAGS